MPWWGWITVGALLLVAEMTIVDLEFYLVFLGVSAFAVGLVSLVSPAGIELPYFVEWLVFAGLSVFSLVVFRQRVYSKLRPPPEGEIREGVEGEAAVAVTELAPGATGEVTLRGTRWNAINRGPETIRAGARCHVLRSEGLVLEVESGTGR
jgi:membrane protein implicated in regulation of membrane protease activity